MKKSILFPLLFLVIICLSSFGLHKFYMSIYQINYIPEKKMLQITTRIFVDDLNAALSAQFKKKTHVCEENEMPEDLVLMQKYLAEHFTITINGQQKNIQFLSKELDANVVVGYFRIQDVAKIKSLTVKNTALFDLNAEQQNIIQTTIYGKKESLLLTQDNLSGNIKF